MLKPKNLVPGTDFAGKVEAIGKMVVSFKFGDKVYGFDDLGLSSKAQLVVPETKVAMMPNGISFQEAAASLEGAHYAFNFIKKVDLKKSDRVLVNGATGAIGSAAVQLLKHFGATVTAVGNAKNLELLRSIGADKIIDYTKEDFTKYKVKYDYIFDTVGKSTFFKCKHLLQPKGVYISSELGPKIQNPLLAIVTTFIGTKRVIFPIPSDCKRSALFINTLYEKGAFKAVIDRQYPLKEIATAYSYVEKGEKTGNVIINIEDEL